MKRAFDKSGSDMTDAVANGEEKPTKPKKSSMLVALILALVGGGAGFYAMKSGLIPFGHQAAEDDMNEANSDSKGTPEDPQYSGSEMMPGADSKTVMEDIAFVEIDPITISLLAGQSVSFLRFRAQLEVNSEYEREVSMILPRVTDVLNGYLRALELEDLTGPLALVRLRSQMLRRVQVVTGRGRVRDLLIMEFVLN
jgi:flagellar protein FliL